MKDPPSTQSLVSNALSGSAGGWFDLVDRFSPLIWSIARSCGLSESDAEDVAQTVFTKLVVHLQGIRNHESLPSWIATSTKREAWRTKALADRFKPRSELHLESSPEGDFELVAQRQHDVRQALLNIHPRCRELLTALFGDQSATYEQAAERLGLRANSIGATRNRCLHELMSQFEDQETDF
jgi:RNA polymerase sigma factor (sigma-70 family)